MNEAYTTEENSNLKDEHFFQKELFKLQKENDEFQNMYILYLNNAMGAHEESIGRYSTKEYTEEQINNIRGITRGLKIALEAFNICYRKDF